MYRLMYCLLLGLIAPAPAFAQAQQEAPGPLSLGAALQLAEAGNPTLSAARHELAAQGGSLQQAQALPNPELQTVLEDTRRASRSTTVQVNQLIELGGKRGARAAVALRGQDLAQAALALQAADTRAAVTTAFADVLAAQEGLRLADSAQALAARASDITARRVTAGKASPVEATRAKVLEASVRLEGNLARSNLTQARQRLAALWGASAPRFTEAEGRLDVLPPLPSPAQLAARRDAAPGVRQARSHLAQRQAMLEVEQRRATPDVTVSIGMKRSAELGRNQAIIGLALPLPLFDRNAGNQLDALRRSDKAGDELAAAQVQLQTALAQTRDRLATARLDAESLQNEIVPGAQSAYDAASRGFEFGKFAFLDVLDAQRTLLQAKNQTLRALTEAHHAAAELERLLGAPVTTQESLP
ncbi:TolC family protein [Janthinobacterium psychrotolerans]|uniref:Outer membrane protein, cobalt-zinc-cadmium efflux system n=1 Tax=Janthinobacterium psychrotolerans TaxID=1747903 RepID=A0A1A7BU26_9BURK|nr:TolC family protein [Janthinobacterium psychrotolerans]OBV37012.1 outer membrane protein, cobalt-zinc-cadmium efflux system [Janthinobacterium psychrotolerans]